jgi:serine/arginine repetitive matrix protein 2
MYNGIGLQTPRGSGTNGFVTRNLGFARPIKKKDNRFDPEEDKKRQAKLAMARQPDPELVEHNRRRAIEVQVEEWAESVDLYSEEYVMCERVVWN